MPPPRALLAALALALLAACAPAGPAEPAPAPAAPAVAAAAETRPVVDSSEAPAEARYGDADDPAIWVHPDDPALSLVAGVLKGGGMELYDLAGRPLQTIRADGGRLNNVDGAYGFSLGGRPADLIVATDRFRDTLAIFRVDPARRELVDVADPAAGPIFTPAGQEPDRETTAYGLALYRSPASGRLFAFVSRRATGEVAQLELLDAGGAVGWARVRTLSLPIPAGGTPEDAQSEGMVADAELGALYIGQENVGIWKVGAEPDAPGEPALIHRVAPAGDHLRADAEGLTIYYAAGGAGYLLASSQGDSTFAVFAREGDNRYLGSFQVGAGEGVDGAEESDGAAVLSVPLGGRFPAGLLVVHDGRDDPGFFVERDGRRENASTNFKLVRWEQVAAAFSPPLAVDTASYRVRP